MWLLKTDTRYLLLMLDKSPIEDNPPASFGNLPKTILHFSDKCCYLDEYVPVGSASDIIMLEEWNINYVDFKGKIRGLLNDYNSLIEWCRTTILAYYYVSNLEVVHKTSHLKENSIHDCGALKFTYGYKCPVIADGFVINCRWSSGLKSDSLISVLNRTLKNEPGQ